MKYTPADSRQQELFVKAAMARYAEKGVSEEAASKLLAGSLAKVASALGLIKTSRDRIDAYKHRVSKALGI